MELTVEERDLLKRFGAHYCDEFAEDAVMGLLIEKRLVYRRNDGALDFTPEGEREYRKSRR